MSLSVEDIALTRCALAGVSRIESECISENVGPNAALGYCVVLHPRASMVRSPGDTCRCFEELPYDLSLDVLRRETLSLIHI